MLRYVWLIIITVLIWVLGCKDSMNENIPLEKSIHLLKPNGGEMFQFNDTINVSWGYENTNKFNLLFSINGGVSWSKIAENLIDISEFSFLHATTTESDMCLIKIEDFSDKSIFDISDEFFSVRQIEPIEPTIKIISAEDDYTMQDDKLSFSFDGKYIIGSTPASTSIWSTIDGKFIKKLPTRFLSVSPIENLIVGYNSSNDSISFWNLETESIITSFPTWWPFDVKISHNGKYLAIARTRWIDIWDIAKKEKILNITVRDNPTEDNAHSISFSPDDKIIASANDKLRLYDVLTGSKISEINKWCVGSIDFSPDGIYIATGGAGGEMDIWNVQTGELISKTKVDEELVMSLEYNQNGNLILIGTKGEILLWNLLSGSLEQIIYAKANESFRVAYSKNNKYVSGKGSKFIVLYGPMK